MASFALCITRAHTTDLSTFATSTAQCCNHSYVIQDLKIHKKCEKDVGMACQKVCKQGKDDIVVKENLQSLTPASFHNSSQPVALRFWLQATCIAKVVKLAVIAGSC